MRTVLRQTPYNDNYSTCERTYAELRLYAEDLDPKIITERLKITPTTVSPKSVVRYSKTGRTRKSKENGWFLSSEEKIVSKDLRRHLDWLLEKLQPVEKELKELQTTPNVVMSIWCIWWSAHGHGGPTLWPEQMQRMASLDLECAFDIYFVSETLE